MSIIQNKDFMAILNTIDRDYCIEEVKRHLPLVRIYDAINEAHKANEKIKEEGDNWWVSPILENIICMLEEYISKINDKTK